MLQIFNEFMHIYFWVYLVMIILFIFSVFDDNRKNNTNGTSIFFAGVGLSLWIMSFHY